MMIDTKKNPFRVANRNVNPRKSLRCLFGCGFYGIVVFDMFRNTIVTRITVGMNNRCFVEQPFGQFRISFASEIRKKLHAKDSCTSVLRKILSAFGFGTLNRFNSNKHSLLALIASSTVEKVLVRILLAFVSSKEAIVKFNRSRQSNFSIYSAHCLAYFLHHVPHWFIALQSESLLHVIGRNRLWSAGHQKHAVVPYVKGQFAMHHDCAAANGGLCLTFHAFPPMHRTQPTQPFGLALSTFHVAIFSLYSHVRNTCCFVGELIEKFFCVHFLKFSANFHTHNVMDLRSTFKRIYIKATKNHPVRDLEFWPDIFLATTKRMRKLQ
jgi:hypothetical protein